jgi:hypothetical protein
LTSSLHIYNLSGSSMTISVAKLQPTTLEGHKCQHEWQSTAS